MENFKQYSEITTHDGKVYRCPGEDNPQLWAVHLSIQCLDKKGYMSGTRGSTQACLYVTRQTLIDHGLLPAAKTDSPPPEPPRTAEDLLLELLSHVGVFPND